MNLTLDDLGWSEYKKTLPADVSVETSHIARVSSENMTNYKLLTERGECTGVLRGNTLMSQDKESLPKVGDWVVISDEEKGALVAIESLLPRNTVLSRNAVGDVLEKQILVTNVDNIFIMQSLNDNFNVNRLQRYLVMVENSGASPIIILTKSDLVDDVLVFEEQVKNIAPTVPVFSLSMFDLESIEMIMKYLKPRSTSVFVGSSGVGKSSLLNILLGSDIQETKTLRDDDQGRHATTRRELFVLPNGAIVIDTPGMREVNVKGVGSIEETFGDVERLTGICKFRKCDHVKTEGCALIAAVKNGSITQKHVDSYLKILNEQDFERSKIDKAYSSRRTSRIRKTQKERKKILNEKYKKIGFKDDFK